MHTPFVSSTRTEAGFTDGAESPSVRNALKIHPQPPSQGNQPREVSLIISTCGRPYHLERCLESVACQTVLNGVEVIVSEDGSQGDTRNVVRRFAERGICPVYFAAQEHDGFRVARVRNNGVALATSPYLVFVDGDCALPHHHVECHLEMRAKGLVVVGESVRLEEGISKRITPADVRLGNLHVHASPQEARRMRKKQWKDQVYGWLRVPMRPRLTANNFAMWRDDFVRVNGFDEAYVGWGLEDVDLQRRLSLLKLRFRTSFHRTVPVHFWHPYHATFRRNAEGSANRRYFDRGVLEAACAQGFSRTLENDFEAVDMSFDGSRRGDVVHKRAA